MKTPKNIKAIVRRTEANGDFTLLGEQIINAVCLERSTLIQNECETDKVPIRLHHYEAGLRVSGPLAISSGISHHSNTHEWEITTVRGAITSPQTGGCQMTLSGRPERRYWTEAFLAPEERAEVNYCGRNRSFGP